MAKLKLPVRTVRFNLKGDYEGWWMDMRTNPPMGPFLDAIVGLNKADKDKVEEILPPMFALLELVLVDWNAVNEEGDPLAKGLEGLKQLPVDMLTILANNIAEQVTLPKVSNGT